MTFDMVENAREEGFLIPRASTEALSFAKLRRIIGSSLHSRPRRSFARPSRDPVSLPARVTLPTDSI